jgi:hypothetical protein
MSTIGVVNEYMNKIMDGLRTTDTSDMFNPGVSSLSFGGEISIGFTASGGLQGAVQSAIPMISTTYKGVQDSLRRLGNAGFNRYKNALTKKFMWLYMV